MEFVVRALRGWAVPLVIPIPEAPLALQQGQLPNERIAALLRILGAEVATAAEHFAAGRITSSEAARTEATLQAVSDAEVPRTRS
jgi:hypothetical protein